MILRTRGRLYQSYMNDNIDTNHVADDLRCILLMILTVTTLIEGYSNSGDSNDNINIIPA